MRIRVVCQRRNAVAQPLLNRGVEAFIAGGAAAVLLANPREECPLRGILQIADAAEILIRRGGASGIADPVG